MKTFKKVINSKRGFSLIEVVVSMLIVSLIAMAFLSLFGSAYSTIFMMGRKTKAVNEAQTLIEAYYVNPNIINTDYPTWKLVTGDMNNTLVDYNVNPSNLGFNKFYKIESVTQNGKTMSKVTVLVFYNNNTKSIKLSALAP